MVHKGWAFEAVCSRAGFTDSIGQTWRSTREYSNLGQMNVLILEAVKEGFESWPTKVSYRAKTSEQAAARYFLKVSLTDIL